MSDPYDNPVCLPDPEDCYIEPPIGFVSRKKFVSCVVSGKRICAEAEGHGHSTSSQAEADQMALDEAMEQAAEKLGWKIRLLNWLGFSQKVDRGMFQMVAPLGTMDIPLPWEGRAMKKPWEYKVTATIPHLNTVEPLCYVIQILRAQTVRPYIIVVDTGSDPETRKQLEKLRAPDLEIHYLMSNSYRHSSEPVTAAMDLAQSICKTDYLFHTHSDVFLRKFTALEEMIALTSRENPVTGYRMSPRDWVTNDWEWMVGHTALMLYMPLVNEIGATWSMQRMNTQFGYEWSTSKGGWPDTEVGFNNVLRHHGIKPQFIGEDRNYERQVDDFMDHVRSYPGSKVYAGDYHNNAKDWMKEAISEAKERLRSRKIVRLAPVV